MHPHKGIPQLHFDQLNIVVIHHHELKQDATITAHYSIKEEDEWEAKVRKLGNENDKDNESKIIPNKLTRKYLKQQSDWADWKNPEAKQLDQYEQKQMFGEPEDRPINTNILSLLWTNLIKTDRTNKS